MKERMGVDEQCVALAEHFIDGDKYDHARRESVQELAEMIQAAVEDWFALRTAASENDGKA